MTEEMVIEVLRQTLIAASLVALPPLLAVVVVGVVINLLQTVTQIRDPALAFVPKMLIVGLVLLLSAPWQFSVLREYTEMIFNLIAEAGV